MDKFKNIEEVAIFVVAAYEKVKEVLEDEEFMAKYEAAKDDIELIKDELSDLDWFEYIILLKEIIKPFVVLH